MLPGVRIYVDAKVTIDFLVNFCKLTANANKNCAIKMFNLAENILKLK